MFGPLRTMAAGTAHKQLLDELTPEEKKQVDKSSMARDFVNYFGKGYSCSESTLMVCLRAIGQPESRVAAAAAFGGGMGRKDHCGLLTGGLMGIGFASSGGGRDREAAKKWRQPRLKAFWSWWESMAPIRCAEIRPAGSSSGRCMRLGRLAAAELERLFWDFESRP